MNESDETEKLKKHLHKIIDDISNLKMLRLIYIYIINLK